MEVGSAGLRLRIFVHEELQHDHQPLYAALVALAQRQGLAGAVVLRGIEGFGLHQRLVTTRLVDVANDLPVIVEIVDTEPAIRAFLPLLDDLLPRGTATLSPVRILRYDRGRRQ
jgi:PII-like signaling protein